MINSLPELCMYRPGPSRSGRGPLICARTRLGEDDARDSSRISDVHGYWVCSAYHFNLHRLSARNSAVFRMISQRKSPSLPALRGSGAPKEELLTQGSSRTPIGAMTCHLLGVDTNRRWRRLGAKLSWTHGRCFVSSAMESSTNGGHLRLVFRVLD